MGDLLLLMAHINPGKLRDLGEAICLALSGDGIKPANDRAVVLELIAAYESCHQYPATLPEIRRAFIGRYDDSRWLGDVSVRRTLGALGLPLGKAKRGRPRGAKSKQKEYGLDKQPRKLIHTKG